MSGPFAEYAALWAPEFRVHPLKGKAAFVDAGSI